MKHRRVVALLLENTKNEVLLMLRDNKPEIPFPEHWAFIGGDIEPDESPEQAMSRELSEELGVETLPFSYYGYYHIENIEYYVYYVSGDYKTTDFVLGEGQALGFFDKTSLAKQKVAFRNREIIADFYQKK